MKLLVILFNLKLYARENIFPHDSTSSQILVQLQKNTKF